jgi:hypothetical protein
MMRRDIWLRWLVLISCTALALWLGWRWFSPSCTYNYRLTLEAQTPQGVSSGASVIQLTNVGRRFVPGFGARGYVRITGEAVYVDLGGGKNLFVSLTDVASGRPIDPSTVDGALDAGSLPAKIFNFMFGPLGGPALCKAAEAAMARGPVEVPFVNLPTTVTFRDINNPLSVELVDPRSLSSSFGAGYSLKSAKIAITEDAVTEKIDRVLPWLKSYGGRGVFDRTEYSKITDPLKSQLGPIYFKNNGL